MRLVNRPLAVILAAALAVGAIIVIIEVIAFAVNHGPVVLHWTTWYRWAGTTRWDQLVIRVWSAVLIVIGAAILAVELKPRRVTRLPLRSDNDATDAAVTHRGLAGTLRAAATGVDGVSAVALRWIVALLISTDRAGDIPIPVATYEGTTILRPGALTGALVREIGTYHGVDAARARIIGDAAAPEVVIVVTASQTADLRALHQRIETEALSHLRHAVSNTSLPIQLHLDVSRRAA